MKRGRDETRRKELGAQRIIRKKIPQVGKHAQKIFPLTESRLRYDRAYSGRNGKNASKGMRRPHANKKRGEWTKSCLKGYKDLFCIYAPWRTSGLI